MKQSFQLFAELLDSLLNTGSLSQLSSGQIYKWVSHIVAKTDFAERKSQVTGTGWKEESGRATLFAGREVG
jgi:hypothetical protein